MKEIKLTGRERAVLRHIDFTNGTLGADLLERTRLSAEDLVLTVNALIEVGFAEMEPYAEATDETTFSDKLFVVNPSYALELKAAMFQR